MSAKMFFNSKGATTPTRALACSQGVRPEWHLHAYINSTDSVLLNLETDTPSTDGETDSTTPDLAHPDRTSIHSILFPKQEAHV